MTVNLNIFCLDFLVFFSLYFEMEKSKNEPYMNYVQKEVVLVVSASLKYV